MSTTDVKVNNKQTKETLRNALGAMMPILADNFPELASKIDKALVSKSTNKATLEALLYDATEAGKTVAKVPVENQAKPKKADPDIEEEEIVEKSEKKTLKKPNVGGIKKSKPENKEETTTPQPTGSLPLLKIFPQEINLDSADGSKIKLVPAREVTDIDTLVKLIDSGVDIYIATYWTARHLKQYDYSGACALKEQFKSFPNDLDILQVIYSCERISRIWAASLYTDGMFRFDAEMFEPVEDTNIYTGEKSQLRVAQGMEFEVYKVVTE